MSIYIRRPEWFRDLMRAEIAASEKRVYTRIKENALGEVCERLELDGIDGRLDGIDERMESMAEDVRKSPLIEAEIREINQTQLRMAP